MRWLCGPAPSAVTEALRAVVPELSGLPVDIPDLTPASAASAVNSPDWRYSQMQGDPAMGGETVEDGCGERGDDRFRRVA
jgi:hypothetical protein